MIEKDEWKELKGMLEGMSKVGLERRKECYIRLEYVVLEKNQDIYRGRIKYECTINKSKIKKITKIKK